MKRSFPTGIRTLPYFQRVEMGTYHESWIRVQSPPSGKRAPVGQPDRESLGSFGCGVGWRSV